jgi:hypothetical protein
VVVKEKSYCAIFRHLTTTRDTVMEFTKVLADEAGWNELSLDV